MKPELDEKELVGARIGQTYDGGWEEAPSWAKWKAQDADGTWSWFGTKPKPHNFGLYVSGTFMPTGKGEKETIKTGSGVYYLTNPNPSWRKTISKRPTAAKDNLNGGK